MHAQAGQEVGGPAGIVPAQVELEDCRSPRTRAKMQALGAGLALPARMAWLPPAAGPVHVRGMDLYQYGEEGDFEDDVSVAFARPVATCADAELLLKELTRKGAKRQDWNVAHSMQPLLRHLDADPGVFGVSLGRPRSKGAEGVFVGHRELHVQQDCAGRVEVSYIFWGDFAYVVPQARKRGLGKAIAAVAAMQMGADVRHLAGLDAVRGNPRMRVRGRVSGEAASEGGMAVLDAMTAFLRFVFATNGLKAGMVEDDYDF